MSYLLRSSPSQTLLDDMVSAVERYVMLETGSSTSGCQIEVSWTRNELMHCSTVRLRCGDLDSACVFADKMLERVELRLISEELVDFVREFVQQVYHDLKTLALSDLAVILWEEHGIGLGGEW